MADLRIGLLGAGFIGSFHARAFAQVTGTQVVAVCDAVPAKAARLATELGATAVADLEATLALDLDAVVVGTPTPTHVDLVVPALEAGMSVLCEKPLARTLAEAEQIVAADDASSGVLMVGHVTRYEPDHRRAAEVVADGALGRLAFLSHSITTGFPGWSEDGWLGDVDQSGGPLLDLAVHSFDYLAWLTGSPVVRVTAFTADSRVGPMSYGVAHVRHANGAIGRVEASWAHPPGHGFALTTEVVGTEGRLTWDYEGITAGALHPHVGDSTRYELLGEEGYYVQAADFVAAVRAGGPSPVPARDGLAALRTALGALESARTGQVVDLMAAS